MSVKNNYWKTLSKTNRFYTTWPGGWEIHVRTEQYTSYHKNVKGRCITLETPKVYEVIVYDIPKSCPRASRANFRKELARDKRIAQSVTTKEDYQALWKRIDKEDWEFIESNDLKDEALVHWANNTRTADEYYRLLRYN